MTASADVPSKTPPSAASLETALFAFLGARFSPLTLAVMAVFAVASVGYGAGLIGQLARIEAVAVAVIVLALLAFQLAVGDAMRDQTHAGGRWDEPVARPALIALAMGAAGAQAVLSMALHPPVLGPLLLAWAAIGLASQDFFIPSLKSRPGLSAALHLSVLAAAGLYGASIEPLRRTGEISGALWGYVALTLACGFGLEVARKTQAAVDEREGVQTYSRAWGPGLAGMAAAVAGLIGLVAACAASLGLSTEPLLLLAPILTGGAAIFSATAFALKPTRAHGDRMRMTLALFVIAAFCALGLAPWLVNQ
jgi:4-hydroxybenzoate polyprenyltransferase